MTHLAGALKRLVVFSGRLPANAPRHCAGVGGHTVRSRPAGRPAGRFATLPLLVVLVGLGWLMLGMLVSHQSAFAQAVATPEAGPAPTPTLTGDQRLQERQLDKLTYEIRLLQQQEQSLSQEQRIGEWRAIASTLTDFGQLAVGLGLLVILARGLERWTSRDVRRVQPMMEDDRQIEREI